MKKVYQIDVDCAMCARKIEDHLNKNNKIDSATIDYAAKRVFITSKEELSIDELNNLAHEVEDDAVIFELEDSKKEKIFGVYELTLLIRIIFSALLGVGALLVDHFRSDLAYVYIPMYVVALLVVLYDIALGAIESVIKEKDFFTEDMLITVASIGACCLMFLGTNAFFEAIMVVILSQIGELLEDIATSKSRAAIVDAIALRNEHVNLVVDGEIQVIDSKLVNVGDIIRIKVGEIVPCDGVLYSGEGYFDTSSITGEFVPVKTKEGQEVLSGYKLSDGSVDIKVTKLFKDSTANKILELVQNSGAKKPKATRFVDKFAKIYTPIIFGLAFLIVIVPSLVLTLTGHNEITTLLGETRNVWSYFLYIGLSVLLIGCPCAIVISIPLSFFAGVGLASKNKIVVKGSNYFDKLCELKTVVVDKTGTITEGVFEIVDKKVEGLNEEEFNSYVVSLENLSNHPVSKAIVKSINSSAVLEVKDYQERQGLGISGVINNKKIAIGNKKMMEKYGVSVDELSKNETVIYVCVDSKYAGYVALGDKVKESSRSFVAAMKKHGIDVAMLSGDNKNSVARVAENVGITTYKGELLPDQKISKLENIMSSNKGATAFVGDGINDSPSIIRSDIGIAMGQLGSDIALDNSDIVIMDDDISKVDLALRIAKKTRNKAIANIAIALTIKFLLIVLSLLGVFGSYTMLVSVFADTGLTVLLILNALLLFKSKIK